MLILNLPKSFKIGDTIDYRTPDETVRITWRDAKTLVIEPDDVRTILLVEAGGGLEELVLFAATDKGVSPSEYDVNVVLPDPDAKDDIRTPKKAPNPLQEGDASG